MEQVAATGTPTVVVVLSGRVHTLTACRRTSRRGRAGVPAGGGGRRRAGRRAHRRDASFGPAAGHDAAPRGAGARVRRAPRRRGDVDVLQRVHRRLDRPAVPVRPRPHVHDLRVLGPRGLGERHVVAGRGHRSDPQPGHAGRHRGRPAVRDRRRRLGRPSRPAVARLRPGRPRPRHVGRRPVRRASEPPRVLRPRDALRVRAGRAEARGRVVVGRPPARGRRDTSPVAPRSTASARSSPPSTKLARFTAHRRGERGQFRSGDGTGRPRCGRTSGAPRGR